MEKENGNEEKEKDKKSRRTLRIGFKRIRRRR
jgi:hypothetical protein